MLRSSKEKESASAPLFDADRHLLLDSITEILSQFKAPASSKAQYLAILTKTAAALNSSSPASDAKSVVPELTDNEKLALGDKAVSDAVLADYPEVSAGLWLAHPPPGAAQRAAAMRAAAMK